jgi:hypothetical protein
VSHVAQQQDAARLAGAVRVATMGALDNRSTRRVADASYSQKLCFGLGEKGGVSCG